MREFIDGNEAIARAAIHAGCNFFAGYPITPATSILLHMTRELPKVGGVAIQGEDEIASFGFCIGAALAGSKVMTATSGPGISLYSESIGAAIMVEIPIVIIDVQRMGPATGAPTLGSYGDIQFVRWGNSGGFPIIALAPTNVAECYNLTLKAFDLAERFQVPVFVLTDKEISLTKSTINISDLKVPKKPNPKSLSSKGEKQIKHIPEIKNINQFLGGPNLIRRTTSSHTNQGYITKNSQAIREHNQHLSNKIQDHIDEISLVKFDGQEGAKTLVLSYGITTQSVIEAVHYCRDLGERVSHLIIFTLWPIPSEEIIEALKGVKRVIFPELNLGLYKLEIERLMSDNQMMITINKIDGTLISPTEISNIIRSA